MLAFSQNFVNIVLMEFAVIKTGGKQYKVSKGDFVTIEKIKGEFKEGDKITFDQVLLVDDGKDTTIGTPFISGAKVEAEITEIGRTRKVLVVKYKQKSRYLRRNGHRQPYFQVKILSIK
jgi:large subunit ribosomal protein L21